MSRSDDATPITVPHVTAPHVTQAWAALAAAFVVTAAPAALAQSPRPSDPAKPEQAVPQALAQPASPQTAASAGVVTLEADAVINDDIARTVTAEGDVQARHNGRTLRADRIIYYLDTGEVVAEGGVEVIGDDGSSTFADRVQADTALNIASAAELRAHLAHNGTLAARAALSVGEGRSELRKVVYTSCPICDEKGEQRPTWTLRARRAVQDQETRLISYEGAVLEVIGVPVLYLPWFAHPDPSAERHSGFLTPTVGLNRRVGAMYAQPYYWAISPHQDLTAGLRLHELVNPVVDLEYRKRFYSGDLQLRGTITQEQEFDGTGDRFGDETTRSSLFGQGLFQVNDYWRWGFGVERISDDFYLRRYGLDGYGQRRGPHLGDFTRLISQLYATGQDDKSYAAVSLVSFQGLRQDDTSENLPVILPYVDYDRVVDEPFLDGQLRVQANTAVLERSVGLDSARISAGASWRRDAVIGPGWVVSPFAQVRGDAFRNEVAADEYETFGRAVGLAGAEIAWPFMRVGERLDMVVEPVAMAAYGSESGDDERIANEDSIGFEVDDSNILRANAAPNYDLWEPGARVSLGVRATATNHAGQSARAFIGRRWRDEVAPVFTVQNNLEGRATDWVGSVEADLGRHFGAEMRFRLEDETLELQRLDADIRASVGRFDARARYFQVDATLAPGNPTEEIAGAVGVRLAGGWRMQMGLRRDLDSNINVSQDIRAIYTDDCTYFEFAYTRSETQAGPLGPDEGFVIRFGLTSLGRAGGR